MSDYTAAIAEELEVLESIYPDELEKLSEDSLRIRVEPEEPVHGYPLTCSLLVTYPSTYPDSVPDMELTNDPESESIELSTSEHERLMDGLKAVGEESLGMAMVFTLVSWLKEELTAVLNDKAARDQAEADEKYRKAEEAEAARKRGTPVTRESFTDLMARLRKRNAEAKRKFEEDKIKNMTAKEREEYKKWQTRPSGRQLFESSKVSLESDMSLDDEDAHEVDFSKYTREERDRARQEAEEAERAKEAGGGVDVYDSD